MRVVGDALIYAAGGVLAVLLFSQPLGIEPVSLWAVLAALVCGAIPFFRRRSRADR